MCKLAVVSPADSHPMASLSYIYCIIAWFNGPYASTLSYYLHRYGGQLHRILHDRGVRASAPGCYSPTTPLQAALRANLLATKVGRVLAQTAYKMQALTFEGKQHIALSRVPKPDIQDSTDAIIRVLLCGICGRCLPLLPHHAAVADQTPAHWL
eukprot:GHRR01031390.1.p1 GENE.GHRR01031390.1~~GHRR01031390.1.p1  ORF type:complete len:154 (+),score=9.86 GHRR01031390.1:154-615(+)